MKNRRGLIVVLVCVVLTIVLWDRLQGLGAELYRLLA
jgi:hypothetical protein